MGEGNGEVADVESARATSSGVEASTSKSTDAPKKNDEESKRIPKWVPIVAGVVLVTITLAAVIPAVVNARNRRQRNEADLFQSRTGELLLAEPLKGAEWRTASFTPAPPGSRAIDNVRYP